MHANQISAALLEILVCPACHRHLEPGPAGGMVPEWLRCLGCGRRYPIEDGIPVMLESRAAMASPSEPAADA